ncbi:MAG: purine-nucleoside phosphorylase [Nitriliruptorales bacterium]|nr:purine-nucleoside phosphorylase [Nitriliruptorales bacterium]
MREQPEHVRRASLTLAGRLRESGIDVLLTLGSGLSGVADQLEDPVDVPVAAVPGLPVSRVPGHSGTLRYGRFGGKNVLAQMGRVHLYEGHTADEVTRVVEVAAELGCRSYVVTNAAGGLDPDMTPGEIMVISDHLNLTGESPLRGVLRDGSPVFLDMSEPYDRGLQRLAVDAGDGLGLSLRQGVYAGLVGPAYETRAEVGMLRTLGADAVGMSTVLEVIAARAHNMRVLGMSSITNVHGAGVETSHEEVIEVGARAAQDLSRLLLEVLPEL